MKFQHDYVLPKSEERNIITKIIQYRIQLNLKETNM